MLNNFALPTEATHSSLDIFEKPPLLVTFDHSFEQKTGPLYSPSGSSLEFEVIGDRNNFIDLQKIYLEVKCKVTKPNGANLDYDGTDATKSDNASLANNALHALFNDCTVSANGIKISSANGLYAQKAFIETEFSHGQDAKKTWLGCQGYLYESDPATLTNTIAESKQSVVRQSREVTLYGRLAVDFLSCEKHLVSGVTLRISFRRSQNEFVIMSESDAKNYKLKFESANIYVRKMTVSDHVVNAIEKTLIKTPAIYRYNEVITKNFLVQAGSSMWKHEDIFTKEPIRRLIVAMSSSESFNGTNNVNPFHFQKFDLREIIIYRNGFPVAGTPINTEDDKRIYFNSMGALAYVENGHGIPLAEFPNHYIMVFDLTSTQEATHDFIHPELTNSSITVELKFQKDLDSNIEVICLGEKLSTVYIDSAPNVSKNKFPDING